MYGSPSPTTARSSRPARRSPCSEDVRRFDTYPGRSIFRNTRTRTRRTDVAIRRSIAEDLYLRARARHRLRHADHQPAGGGEPAGQLDLARVRRAGVRHRPRAAPGARRIRSRSSKLPLEAARRDDRAEHFASLLACSARHRAFRPDCQGHVERSERRGHLPRATRSRRSSATRWGASAAPARTSRSASARAATRRRCARAARASRSGKEPRRDHRALHPLYGGQHFLMAPLDRGFNRLAWIVPYALAGHRRNPRRLRRHARVPPAGRNGGGSEARPWIPLIEERLDDELRNLD